MVGWGLVVVGWELVVVGWWLVEAEGDRAGWKVSRASVVRSVLEASKERYLLHMDLNLVRLGRYEATKRDEVNEAPSEGLSVKVDEDAEGVEKEEKDDEDEEEEEEDEGRRTQAM